MNCSVSQNKEKVKGMEIIEKKLTNLEDLPRRYNIQIMLYRIYSIWMRDLSAKYKTIKNYIKNSEWHVFYLGLGQKV